MVIHMPIKSIAAFLAALFIAAHYAELDDKLWYQIHDLIIDQGLRDRAVWLPDYQVDIDGMSIQGIVKNASGITYNSDSNSLWVVTNEPTVLYELNDDLHVKRQVSLKDFVDTESVVYVGDDQFLLSDERSQTIVMLTIKDDTTSLDLNELKRLSINVDGYGNKGLEGIAYDPIAKVIYTVRERDPMKLMKVHGFVEKSDMISIEKPEQIDVDELFLDDLSGLHFDTKSRNLLILSDEAKLLAEVSLQGEKVSYIDLEKGFNGLITTVTQAEGVALDAQRNLYIISEPNLIYRFKNNQTSVDLRR
ncbi:MAG: SdiA-regulated domain-containing protein [Pseudomonadota bacterium]